VCAYAVVGSMYAGMWSISPQSFFLSRSIYSERFVGYFLLSRGGRGRDDCEVVSIRIGYGFRDFTLKHRAS
jgi:hypothetical protein